MLKILVADDERAEREGIRSLIKRFGFPLEVFEAPNGRDALAFLESQPVDILLTDIKMPFMDGLELTERATRLYLEMKVVIFSAHDEFEFARQAVQLDVVHYLLKPIVLEEFRETMEKVIDLCRRDAEKREREQELLLHYRRHTENEQAKQLLDLLEGRAQPAEVEHTRRELEFDLDHVYLMLCDTDKRFFDRHSVRFRQLWGGLVDAPCRVIDVDENRSVLLVARENGHPSREAMAAAAQTLLDTLAGEYGVRFYLALGGPVDRAPELPELFAKLDALTEYRFFFHESALLALWDSVGPSDADDKAIDQIISAIESDIDAGDLDRVEQGLDRLFTALRARHDSVLYTKHVFITLLQRLYRASAGESARAFGQVLEEAFKAGSLEELRSQAQDAVENVRAQKKQTAARGTARIMEEVRAYIAENHMEDISLEMIAAQVYLSPGYLSSLFKKETGQSLMKYITEYRLSRARERLLDTNMKVADIANAVGFSDASYFGMVFRNHYGLSPARYKEKMRQ